MLTKALKKLGRLEFDAERYEAAFDIGVRTYGRRNGCDLDFQVGISGAGFEASRNLNRDELVSIRDWINEALQASEMEDA